MAINFDNSQSSKVTLQASEGCSVLKFPINNKVNNVLTSGFAGISNVSGLSNCISNLQSKFYYTNDINSNCSYSYATDSGSIAQVCNSFIFGSNGIAKSNYYNNSQIVHSINAFNCKGGAQNTIVLSKVCTFNNNCTQILSGIIDQNTVLFNCFDIIGKSFTSENCFAVFNIKNNIIRGTGFCACIGYCSLITGASCNLNQDFCLQIVGENNCSWNINVSNASGIQWLTRASILEVYATGSEVITPSTFGIYWKCEINSNWFNLSNWFSDTYVTTALSYPESSTNVIMSGNCAAYVDIDCNLWIQPNSIDTTRITDLNGICLYSNNLNIFSGNIYGNVNLYGNIIFN